MQEVSLKASDAVFQLISSRSSDDREKGKFSISETWLQSEKIMYFEFFPLDYTAFLIRMQTNPDITYYQDTVISMLQLPSQVVWS